MSRPALKVVQSAQAQGGDESAFFAQLKEVALKAEKKTSAAGDRFELNKLLFSSFAKKREMFGVVHHLPDFPAEQAVEFWRYTLGVMYPEHLGFLASVDDAGLLLHLAEQEVVNLFALAENPAPWRRDDYRRLAAAVINTVDKHFRESAAA